MNKKFFYSYRKRTALFTLLSTSLFSFSLLEVPVLTSSINTAFSEESTETTVLDDSIDTDATIVSEINAADSDMIIIEDLIFQLSTASSETLAAYEAYQKAISYQNEWNMILVNKTHPLPDNYTFTQKTIPGYSMTVDERIYEPLLAMLNAGNKDGCRFLICSAYRSYARQTQIYDSHIRDYRAKGYSAEKAKELTERSIALPGSSEHHTGMALDIVATYYQQLNSNFANTKEAQWLKEHAHEYGFILRYPKEKTELTMITFEPWHFRYVGVEAASEIHALNICYEEYIALKEQKAQEALDKLRTQIELDRSDNRSDPVQGNWFSDDYGKYFLYEDQTYPSDTWLKIDEEWYYFLPTGYLAEGWLNLGTSWYYLNEANHSGELITGWYQDPLTEKWYYLDNDTGEIRTGWFMDAATGKRYYLSSDGSLLTASFTPDGYYVDENGVYIPDYNES